MIKYTPKNILKIVTETPSGLPSMSYIFLSKYPPKFRTINLPASEAYYETFPSKRFYTPYNTFKNSRPFLILLEWLYKSVS